MKKRIVSGIMCLAMLLSLLPISAFATESYEAGKIYTATLHDTRNEGSDADKANAIADADLITGYSVVESEPSSSSVEDVNKVITLSGTNLKYHRNGDTPADMGYWIGVAFTAPEGAVKYKMASSSTANNEALPQAFLERFTNATAEVVQENIKGDQGGRVQYFDLTAIPASNHLYIKLQWLDASGEALKDSDNQDIDPVVYEIVRDVTLSKPTLTVTASTGAVLGKSVNDIQSNISATQANANGKITVTGTSKYTSWDAFSSNPSEKKGNYISLDLTAKRDGTAVNDDIWFRTDIPQAWTRLSEADHTIALILKDEGSRNVDVVISSKQPSADATPDFTIDLAGVTCSPASTNAAISAVSIADAAITLPETISSNAVAPAEIKATFAANSEATLNSLDVVLTVDPTATVKTVAGVDGTLPASEAAYNVDQTVNATTGAVSISTVDLTLATAGSPGTPAKVLYVMVTAQDGATKAFYKITAEKSEVAVVAPTKDATVDETKLSNISDGATKTAVTTAVQSAKVEDGSNDVLTSAATEIIAQVEESVDKDEAVTQLGTALNNDSLNAEDVKIVVIPVVKVALNNYTETKTSEGAVSNRVLNVEITAEYKVVATNVSDVDNDTIKIAGDGVSDANAVDITPPGNKKMDISDSIDLSIELPSGFATASSTLYVLHKGEHYHAGSVAGNGTTLTFTSDDGLSPFVIDASKTNMEAKIGNDYYETLQAAVSAAKANDVIELTANPATKAITGASVTFTLKVADANTEWLTGITATATTGKTVTKGAAASNAGYTAVTFTVANDGTPPTPSNPGGGGGFSATVSVPSTSNGKISVNNTNAKKGDTVTVTVTPNTGYEVGTVTVKDANGNTVAVTKVNDTQYTFVMPDGKVSVDATFTQVQQPSDEPFVDVSASDYFYDAVKWAVDKGITTGDGVNTFGPNKSCTRAQMVTFLWRAAGSPAATGSNPFADVPAGEYYTDAVLWAVSQGITNGTGADSFSPNATVSRGQTVTFLYRYAGSPSVNAGGSFNDVATTDYYANAVQWAVNNGITNGTGNGTFSPVNDCTRGQIVTFMYRQMAE